MVAAGLRAPPDLVTEARQVVREKLFVGAAGKGPRIGDYAGLGPLRTWVRVVSRGP